MQASWSLMPPLDLYEKIKDAVIRGISEEVDALVRDALQTGCNPLAIYKEGLVKGIRAVGEKFETGDLFLTDLILAADAMTVGSELLRRAIERETQGKGMESLAKVMMVTVKDDIHDIGKNIVVTMLKVEGFDVTDLGKDIPIDRIVKSVQELSPDILGLSALLTTTMARQGEVIQALREAGVRDSVKVMIGGAPTHEGWAKEIGADGWAPDAISAVKKARELIH